MYHAPAGEYEQMSARKVDWLFELARVEQEAEKTLMERSRNGR